MQFPKLIICLSTILKHARVILEFIRRNLSSMCGALLHTVQPQRSCYILFSFPQHHEAQSVRNLLPPQEPQEALQCPLTHQEEDHVFSPLQGTPSEVQREVHAHPQRWRSPGIVWEIMEVYLQKCKVQSNKTWFALWWTGGPWTLQRPADW